MRRAAFLLVFSLMAFGATQVAASSGLDEPSPQESTAQAPVNPDALPVDVDKIQRRLARPPAIVVTQPDMDNGMPTFRVQVDAQKLTIEQILGPDYLRGPAPMAAAMSHQEFLNMVTPNEFKGMSGFSNGEAATIVLTSLALQWAVKTALEAFHKAQDANQKEAARKEVAEALEALRRARLEAGLPVSVK
jgi:hypothetical protein